MERSVFKRIGCQLPWGRVKVDGLPLCDNRTLLINHTLEYWRAIEYGRDQMIERTNCLLPCSYMEYTVSLKLLRQISDLFVRIVQVAEKIESHRTGVKKLMPMFSSDTILVRKEEEAFPFASLVADCGVILGLFVGFNFLIVWEWMMDLLLIIVHKVIKKHK